jgi:hypothetical protein
MLKYPGGLEGISTRHRFCSSPIAELTLLRCNLVDEVCPVRDACLAGVLPVVLDSQGLPRFPLVGCALSRKGEMHSPPPFVFASVFWMPPPSASHI